MVWIGILIGFLISLAVSSLIIYFVTRMFGEHEGFGTAIVAALIGAAIFWVANYFFGGWVAALIGGIAWLFALTSLYTMGWVKALIVAIVVWVFAVIVSLVLPTLTGPF